MCNEWYPHDKVLLISVLDVSQKNRYFCMHNAGLHAVVLAWFYKVQEFTHTGKYITQLIKLKIRLLIMVAMKYCW